MQPKVVVIGAGAAGYFAALSCAEHHPGSQITILEKNDKILSKVKVSGGGRCNVTNATAQPNEVARQYPRGEKFLKKAFQQFCTQDTIQWFEKRGVALKAEEDGRVFPVSDESQSIIDCLTGEAYRLGIQVKTKTEVLSIEKSEGGFTLQLKDQKPLQAEKVIVCSGGSAKSSGYSFLQSIGHGLIAPVPSLFTFNIPDSPFKDLMGVSDQDTEVKVAGLKGNYNGATLITHWGLSGPAVLKTSAWHARELFEKQYVFQALVNWVYPKTEVLLSAELQHYSKEHPKQVIFNHPLSGVSRRLWERLCELSTIDHELRWCDISKHKTNLLMEHLLRHPLSVKGKTTFKEEFVTCGGIPLQEISTETMESKVCKGLFFAGEVLDIDGITGGYNFQSAWTTGWIAGKNSLL